MEAVIQESIKMTCSHNPLHAYDADPGSVLERIMGISSNIIDCSVTVF